MTDHQAICRAIALIRPVLTKARGRRPYRFSPVMADRLVNNLVKATIELQAASALFDNAGHAGGPHYGRARALEPIPNETEKTESLALQGD